MASSEFLPVVPLRNVVVFPGMVLPLRIGRKKSVRALEDALAHNGGTLLLAAVREDSANLTPDQLYRVGVLAHVEKTVGDSENGYQAVVRGLARVTLDGLRDTGDRFEAMGIVRPETLGSDKDVAAALLKSLKSSALSLLSLVPADTTELEKLVAGIEDLALLSHLISGNLDATLAEKQTLLELDTLKERALDLLERMERQKESLEIQGQIRERVSRKIGNAQRENILRQQLDAIKEELGEGGSASASNYKKRIADSGMPDEVRKIAETELERMEAMSGASPEANVIRNYLDLLCAMPWATRDADRLDLDEAKRVLEADHYGMEKVKRRILQALAVRKLTGGTKSPILLLVGPPGVGKTSLAQSVARAMGRKFARVALGGVRDDAEIRGHRRTYVGAMPGRIVQGIKRAGTKNPVFLLDEVDKLGRSFQGDPAGALLEVLDPEQNSTFTDHYLDVAFDLSEAFWFATANTLETIPPALLDRMEVIELNGYTTAEKLHIARRHLWPKLLEEHGLGGGKFQLSDEALLETISLYTREAGVRELKRQLEALCRWGTEKVVESKDGAPIVVTSAHLEEAIGRKKYQLEVTDRLASPGVVTGLAWTPHGGEILFVEATKMPGTGTLLLTGQLGDVMKESAQLALSLVRSRLALDLTKEMEKKQDLHIHVPGGAIPKDGPSAGVAMLTTLASILSGRRVSSKLAMTGEITLRGAVLPVGGIKEKVIAAHRAGVEHVLLPKRNEPDLKDVPEEVRSALKVTFVETVEEVLRAALGADAVLADTPVPLPGSGVEHAPL